MLNNITENVLVVFQTLINIFNSKLLNRIEIIVLVELL